MNKFAPQWSEAGNFFRFFFFFFLFFFLLSSFFLLFFFFLLFVFVFVFVFFFVRSFFFRIFVFFFACRGALGRVVALRCGERAAGGGGGGSCCARSLAFACVFVCPCIVLLFVSASFAGVP